MSWKKNILNLWIWHFSGFLQIFEWKSWNCLLDRQGNAFCLNVMQLFKSKFGHTKLFRKWFWNYLEFKSKIAFSPFCLFLTDNIETVFLKLWKWYWSVFCKFLSYEVATVFSKSEAKHWKLFKSEVGHMKHFRKWFGSYLEVKNEIAFSFFCKFLSDNIETVFEKARQSV